MRVVIVLLAAFSLVPSVAQSEPVSRASQRLVSAQQNTKSLRATWTWKRGGKVLAPNTAGVVALSLVRVWERSGSAVDTGARDAALRWGDARIADLAAWRALFDPDAEALAELGRVSRRQAYTDAARAVFDRRWKEATPEEVLARLLRLRRRTPAIVGYDVALVIRAAKAVGKAQFGADLARVALARQEIWMPEEKGQGWSTTSRAALLGALEGLDDKELSAARERLAAGIMKAQGEDGSWANRNTQATAYAVAALASRSEATGAVSAGRAWLTRTQLKDGSWAAFTDGLPEPFVGDVVHEVTAEVVLALAGK